jgi:hypothetical protein
MEMEEGGGRPSWLARLALVKKAAARPGLLHGKRINGREVADPCEIVVIVGVGVGERAWAEGSVDR